MAVVVTTDDVTTVESFPLHVVRLVVPSAITSGSDGLSHSTFNDWTFLLISLTSCDIEFGTVIMGPLAMPGSLDGPVDGPGG